MHPSSIHVAMADPAKIQGEKEAMQAVLDHAGEQVIRLQYPPEIWQCIDDQIAYNKTAYGANGDLIWRNISADSAAHWEYQRTNLPACLTASR